MDYFYCPPDKITKEHVLIDGEEFAHLTHVMRKSEGDEICVVDGRGNAYDVRLTEINKKKALGIIHQSQSAHHEPSVAVTLAVGVLKNPSKCDFLVEKATELGVKEIIPLKTERTIPNHAKVDRWQKLALAAMKQSCRSFLPSVKELAALEDVLGSAKSFDAKLVAHEKADHAVPLEKQLPSTPQSVMILIGPEGGFTEEEIERCVAAGFTTIYLGERST